MKKLLALLVLVSHINFSMFIAQVDEVDVYNSSGQQVEDVNSLIQYVAVVFHCKHKPLKDSDDDNARYFHFESLTYSFYDNLNELKRPFNISPDQKKYPPYIEQRLSSQFFDIQSPPPEV